MSTCAEALLASIPSSALATEDTTTEQVVVTGSRIPLLPNDSPRGAKVYTRDQIDQSGSATVAEFLNTLPDVSLSITEDGFQTPGESTTVRLHGLPIGTTLVLINGRRIGTSGIAQSSGLTYFDLNTIPLAAIDRIEVVSQGSSAVYGSDAIAGVINIILKSRFSGFAANSQYGFANGTHQDDFDVTWGDNWDRGSFMAVASYMTRTALAATDRALTNDQDYVRFGGQNADFYMCPNQADIYALNGSNLPGLSAPYAAVPAGYTQRPSRQEFAATAGTLNRCSLFKYIDLIPASERAGLLLGGTYQLGEHVEFYGNALFSHVQQFYHNAPPILYGQPGFQLYSVSAANPFNPFGEAVGLSDMLSSFGRQTQDTRTTYLDAVVGMRGTLGGNWSWDVGISDSEDRTRYTQSDWDHAAVQAALNSPDTASALNPFVAASPASPALLQTFAVGDEIRSIGRATVADVTLRGSAADLPAGPVRVVFGGEYERDQLYQNQFYFPGPAQITNFHRNSYALFGETRVPVLGHAAGSATTDRLDITLAARWDRYQDFGSKTTPQFSIEFRPVTSVLFRATYSRAFRAPDLIDLHAAATTSNTTVVQDPLRGNAFVDVVSTSGGNPRLRPEEGRTRTLGVVYSGDVDGAPVRLAITQWTIDETNAIQEFSPQVIVNNASLFPGDVVRAATCPGGPPCPLTAVTATYQNFGRIDLAGVDYELVYERTSPAGTFTPAISVTQTYRYAATLTPGSSSVDGVSVAQDTGNWSPRWKGTAAVDWKLAGWAVHLDGRYVSRYRDYDSRAAIGNFWLVDTSVRYDIGGAMAPESHHWQNFYVRLGAVNLFNRRPQFSNFEENLVGYDPTQGDIRGRFVYAQLGTKW